MEVVLWGAAVLLVVVAWIGWSWSPPTPDTRMAATVAPGFSIAARGAPEALVAAATHIVQGDPFRLERTPSPFGFGQRPAPEAVSVPTTETRPVLSVQGIIGPPWRAVVEGIPGQGQAVVVRGGESFGALEIRSITRDRVVIAGPDTVWRLSVRSPWH
jgi:hypothetical protein